MSRLVKSLVVGPVLASLFYGPFAAAREQIPAENRQYGYSGAVSSCDDEGILSRIQNRFETTERRFWQSDATITGFEHIRETAFRPDGEDLIPRRYCRAVAVMANRKRHTLVYAIIESAGIIGMGEGVQFCLAGYDRNFTAEPGCARLNR